MRNGGRKARPTIGEPERAEPVVHPLMVVNRYKQARTLRETEEIP